MIAGGALGGTTHPASSGADLRSARCSPDEAERESSARGDSCVARGLSSGTATNREPLVEPFFVAICGGEATDGWAAGGDTIDVEE